MAEEMGPKPPAAEVWDSLNKLRRGTPSEQTAERQLEAEERREYPIQKPTGDRAKGYRKVG